MAQMIKEHPGLSVCKSGLVIHPLYPYMGASPDGLIKCRCCGPGVLEVKCPFSCKDKSFTEATAGTFFLNRQMAGLLRETRLLLPSSSTDKIL